MVKMVIGEVQLQTAGIKRFCREYQAALETVEQATLDFGQASGLKGKAMEAMKRYISTVYPAACKANILFGEAVLQANERYLNAYISEFGAIDLDSEKLEEQIQQANQLISQFHAAQERLESTQRHLPESQKAIVGPIYQNMQQNLMIGLQGAEAQKARVEDILMRFKAFDAHSSSYFSNLNEPRNLMEKGMNVLDQDHWTGSTFSHYDTSWVGEVEKRWATDQFIKNYQIKKPRTMTDKTFQTYVNVLRKQEKALCVEDGWDKQAIQTYFDIVHANVKTTNQEDVMNRLNTLYGKTKLVGSDVYTAMYENSEYSPKEKIQLVLKQMGAYLDDHGMLQLKGTHRFDPDMAPHATFLQDWAKTVQKVNKGKELTDPKVHQLRIYIDRNNLHYIRKHYKKKEMTDEEALKAYALTELKGKKMIAERARFHNKYLKTESYQTGAENRKRLIPDFHSEFILDVKGNFVSQWNVLEEKDGKIISDYSYYQRKYTQPEQLKEFERQIMDGESYNYANKNDKQHENLDSKSPKRLDYEMRHKIGEKWKSPENEEEYDWRAIDNEEDGFSRKNKSD